MEKPPTRNSLGSTPPEEHTLLPMCEGWQPRDDRHRPFRSGGPVPYDGSSRGEETPFDTDRSNGTVLVYVRSLSTGRHSGLSDPVLQSTIFFHPFKSTLERRSILASSPSPPPPLVRIHLPPFLPFFPPNRGGNSDAANLAWGWPG